MRKFIYRLRQIYWSAVIAVVLGAGAIALAVLGYADIALAVGLCGITVATLSTRD